jgi:hypothetical protein
MANMKHFPFVVLGATCVLGCTPSTHPSTATSTSESPISVGKNFQVSTGHPGWHHDEMMLGVDPTNPKRMIACSVVLIPEQAKRSTVIYATADGGETWKATMDATYAGHSSDPDCAFGADGTAYYLTEIVPENGGIVGNGTPVDIHLSSDGGMTWPRKTSFNLGLFDRSWLVTDTTRSSPYYGRVYSGSWSSRGFFDRDGYGVMYTTDKGATWSKFARVESDTGLVFWVGNCDVATDGFLACTLYRRFVAETEMYPHKGPPMPLKRSTAMLGFVTSTDGGKSLTPLKQILPISFDKYFLMPAVPHLAIDKSNTAFHDRMYITWEDTRTGRAEVYLVYSSDRGKTWSEPVHVSDDRTAPGPNREPWQTMTHIAVSPDGIVGVVWYDRRADSTGASFIPRMAVSFDGGETFTPSVAVSEHPQQIDGNDAFPIYAFSSRSGASPQTLQWMWNLKHYTGGETMGFMSTGPGRFQVVWADNRTHVDQLWTAAVSVRGNAVRNGTPELSGLRDLSKDLQVELRGWQNGYATDTFSLSIRLRNVGKDTITGPVKARVIDISAQVNAMTLLNADAGGNGIGAVIDFTHLLPQGRLAPGDTTGLKVLRLRYPRPRTPILTQATTTMDPEPRYGTNFTLKLRVLGR